MHKIFQYCSSWARRRSYDATLDREVVDFLIKEGGAVLDPWEQGELEEARELIGKRGGGTWIRGSRASWRRLGS